MKKLLYLALVALVCTVFASFKTPGDSCPYEVALNGYKAMMGGQDITPYVSPNTDIKVFEKFEEERQGTLQYMKEAGVTVTNIKIVSLEEDGDKATAKISNTLTANGQSRTDNVDLPLVKVDDEWYMATEQ
jgi:hypothetical protein